ncbi:hypothetical protein D3C76_119320 [compost metagenome]|jgi:hypothetical protein
MAARWRIRLPGVNPSLSDKNQKIAAFGSSYMETRISNVGAAEGCDLLIFCIL